MKYFVTLTILCLFTTCRKKSDIEITAYNYALGEPIADAEVIIVESKLRGGLFSASTECEEIAHATTDANGKCAFDNLKLKTKKGVQYAVRIKSAYGKNENYNCNATENSEIKKTKFNNLVLNASNYDGFFNVKYNNLLSPSVIGDSIAVSVSAPKFNLPGQPFPFGGGGAFGNRNSYGDNGYPYPTAFSSEMKKTIAGKNVLKIYKKKMGIVTQTIDTIKIYPYETKLIEINW